MINSFVVTQSTIIGWQIGAKVLLSWVFFLAGYAKHKPTQEWKALVRTRTNFLSEGISHLIAVIFPWGEMLIAVGIWIPLLNKFVAILVSLLLSLFVLWDGYGHTQTCQCFGKLIEQSQLHWLSNIFLFACSVSIIFSLPYSDYNFKEINPSLVILLSFIFIFISYLDFLLTFSQERKSKRG